MKLGWFGALALGLWVASGPARALEGYTLYDDFSSGVIDPSRWADSERSRQVTANTLRLVQKDWGLTNSDLGTQGISWSEGIARSGPVTQLRANVRVNSIGLTGCAANPNATRVRARLLGTFFNSGNRSPGSNIGDVLAQIYLYRDHNSADAAGVMRIVGTVLMCTSSDCNSATTIGTSASLGTASLGTNVLLQIEWDRLNKQFLFSRDKGTPSAVAYTVDDSADPGNVFKTVGTRTDVASCASGPRAFGYVDAKFDNVSVNASAKP